LASGGATFGDQALTRTTCKREHVRGAVELVVAADKDLKCLALIRYDIL